MKLKQVPVSVKIFIFSLLAVLLTVGVIQGASVLAEPTLEDLVTERDYGTLNISTGIDWANVNEDSQSWELVGLIGHTDLYISHSLWTDADENGQINLDDVYCQEDYYSGILMNEGTYQVWDCGSDYNYYVVLLSENAGIDGVTVSMQVANNNDFGETKPTNKYLYDAEHNALYISKTLAVNDINANDNEFIKTLRFQINTVVEDVYTMNKQLLVGTFFADSINSTLKAKVENKVYNDFLDVNVVDTLTSGIEIQLCDYQYMPFFPEENIHVYVNGCETDFEFDQTNGIIKLYEDAFKTESIIVYITNLNNVDIQTSLLSASQKDVPLAAAVPTWDQIKKSDSIELEYIDSKPQVGTIEQLTFAAALEIGPSSTYAIGPLSNLSLYTEANNKPYISGNKNHFFVRGVNSFDSRGVSIPELRYYFDSLECFKGQKAEIAAGYTSNAEDRLSTLEFEGMGWYWGQRISTDGVIEYQAGHKYLEKILALALGQATSGDVLSAYNNMKDGRHMTNRFKYINQDYDGGYLLAYIAGTQSTKILGDGNITKGKAYFLTNCAHIDESVSVNGTYWDGSNGTGGIFGSETWYMSSAIIVKVDEANQELYVAVVPQTTDKGSKEGTNGIQRLLGFYRVPYKYNPTGTISIKKVDSKTKQSLAGAQYGLYYDANCTNKVMRDGQHVIITTEVGTYISSGDLEINKTYYIKEEVPPENYLFANPAVEGKPYVAAVELTQGNRDVEIVLENDKQYAELEVNVLDLTTEGHTPETPVGGVEFVLTGGDIDPIHLTSDSDGTLRDPNGEIIKIEPGTYQITEIETVENYCMDDEAMEGPYQATPSSTTIIIKGTQDGEPIDEYYVPGSNTPHTFPIKHYEPRQWIELKSQIQNPYQKENTPADANVGLTEEQKLEKEAVVKTEGAKYQLYTKSEILLGYTSNNQPIKIGADTALVVCDSNGNLYTNDGYVVGTADNKNQAWISAEYIKYNGKVYKVPNGEYMWKFVEASNGYYINTDMVSHDVHMETNGNAESPHRADETLIHTATWHYVNTVWDDDNIYEYEITIPVNINSQGVATPVSQNNQGGMATPVIQYRQSGKIEGYVKEIVKYDITNDQGPYVDIRRLSSILNIENGAIIIDGHALSTLAEDVYYNKNEEITSNSVTKLFIKITGTDWAETLTENRLYTMQSPIENVYIQVITRQPVCLFDGTVLETGSIMGYMVSDGNGYYFIDTIQSGPITIPGSDEQRYSDVADSVTPRDIPNGSYTIRIVAFPSEYRDDALVMEDCTTIFWTAGQYSYPERPNVELRPNDSLSTSNVLVAGLWHKNEDPIVPLAPDPDWPDDPDPDNPYDPENPPDPDDPDNPYHPDDPYDPFVPHDPDDPYDPDNPDDPGNPDDSDDIPPAYPEWVVLHNGEYAYRVVDPDSLVVGENGASHYDFSDTLPTNFAMAIIDDQATLYPSKYEVTFYYQVLENEGYDGTISYQNKFYAPFATTSGTNNLSLYDMVAFNKLSKAWKGSYTEFNPNASLGVSLINTGWLNLRLNAFGGTYRILVKVSTTRYVDLGDGSSPLEIHLNDIYGTLTIKTRQLFPLD